MSSRIKNSLLAITIFIFSSVSYADDIDILYAEKPIDTNVLFVMDLSGSMNEPVVGQNKTRLQSLSGALQTIVESKDFEQVNFGVSVFSGGEQDKKSAGFARGISFPVSPAIDVDAQATLNSTGFTHSNATSVLPDAGTTNTREYISLLTTTWMADGTTPIVDALYEAARYFRGESVHWGRQTPDHIRSAHPSTYAYTAPDGNFTATTTVIKPAGTEYQNQTRDNSIGGINCATNATNSCTTRGNSCGLGTNCTAQNETLNRFCFPTETQSECSNRKPTWFDFSSFNGTNCSTNNEGQTVCTDIVRFKAKENITRTSCDAPNTFSCDFLVDTPEVTEVEVSGEALYNSPIIQECAANAIILLSDGAPTENRSASFIDKMLGANSVTDYSNNCDTNTGAGINERCGPELAEFMANEDHNTALDGLQNVQTYAVGFALEKDDPAKLYLDQIATAGDVDKQRKALIAGNEAQLVKAFTDSINDVMGKARSFSSPSYTVDTSTSLTNGAYVYIPVFDRAAGIWPGNLRKFKLVGDVLTDADGKPALDSRTKALRDDARDLWSEDPSTNSVLSGGAANKINPDTRNVLTDNGTDLISLSSAVPNLAFDLSDSAADTNYKDELITFIKGENPSDNTDRNHIGDIIHSKPVQLSYANGKKLIFVGSNEGYLHAFHDNEKNEKDDTNGTEAFAYMPRELLANIKDQYSGVALTKHIYGVDGKITLWLDESKNTNKLQVGNNVLDGANEKAYILFGLRRGGSTYTVLDVTDPEAPSLVMSKRFDVPGKVAEANSWSQPVVANLLWGSNTKAKPVMIVGGGFNDDDSGETAGGNNVYIVDLETRDVIWNTADAFSGTGKVSNFTGTALPNAVPARIRAIDIDRDDSVDRLYFSDTGANIWRVDLNAAKFDDNPNNNNDIKEATLHRVAELGGSGADDRQFFEEPDVAIFKSRGNLVASIAIGSGSRPNPLATDVNDKFFVIYDKAVTSLPNSTDNPLITVAGTYGLETAPVSKTARLDPNYVGWQKSLSTTSGEKVLSSALTFQGKVLFSSFSVLSVSNHACSPSNTNESTLYVLDIFNGIEDLATTYPGGEILDEPKIVYPPGGTCDAGDCQRIPKIGLGKTLIDFPPPKDESGKIKVDIFGNPLPGGGSPLERVYWIDSNKK